MLVNLIYKILRKSFNIVQSKIDTLGTYSILFGNGVRFNKVYSTGIPYVMVARGGFFKIGNSFAMNNGIKGNPIGCYSKCTFFVDRGAVLTIGNNVGVSQTAIICHKSITIGNQVKIGGGVKIYDTDFHALDPIIRASPEDTNQKVLAPVIIEDNVFIGAYSIILKGVTIGKNAIIGAGSVVTKSIPDNQIWAGNPAKFIRNI